MTDVSNELIYEVLGTLQRDVGEVKSSVGDVKTELNALRGHMISLQQDVHNVYGILGRHDAHLERIERRLELSDAPDLT
jgi:septation ring formation regulator EzrA